MDFRPRQAVPARWLTALGAVAAAGCAAILALALAQPSLGLDLAPAEPPESAPLVRQQLAGGSVMAVLSGLGDTHGQRMSLRSDDLAPEPDTTFPAYADYNRFLLRQGEIDTLIRGGPVTLYGSDGALQTLAPAPRSLASLPWQFWLQLLVAVAGLVVGGLVWIFRQHEPVTRYFALTGVGLYLSAGSAAIYSTRELALPAELFRALHATNTTGALLFCGAFVAVLLHYPTRLSRQNLAPALVGIYLLLALGNLLQAFHGFDAAMRIPVLLGFAATAGLAAWQWLRVRHDLVLRAAFQWFLFAWFIGSGLFLMLVFVPALMGQDTGSEQAPSFALFLLIYVGIAFGIARYRLFDLGLWWFRAWITVASVGGLVALDLALIALLHLDQALALTVSLLAIGALYIPLHAWLWRRLAGSQEQRDPMAVMQNIVLSANREPAEAWREALQGLFQPLQLERLSSSPQQHRLADDGTALELPADRLLPALRLCYANRGQRLFSPHDVKTVRTLQMLCGQVFAYGEATRMGMEQERQRIARDMHDSLGGRLLTLLHLAPENLQPQIREALDDMRLTVNCLSSGSATLEEALGQWRAEIDERCDSQQVQLRWQQPEQGLELQLEPEALLHLQRLLRELVSNALRHARPTLLQVRFALGGETFSFSVENDGCRQPPSDWKSGVGLKSIRYRVETLGGKVNCTEPLPGSVRQTCILPLGPAPAEPPAAAEPAAAQEQGYPRQALGSPS
ncbi:hypothetical protein D0B54_09825 [Solimonas sp. K1W22B-7]|uniref:sensor histidine kinase n=1 Tax=Solimonas sp. K1W22B-7 TaxID=2303331 RepID=UPI000E32D92C|nr:ATP-binding protein [Solimonas sp. K1W22B-7]AXQ28966.1 hypothetical protein D0B54_09825 [Solimonas sp. K1W22B-7]